MIIKGTTDSSRGFWTGAAILLLGILIGSLFRFGDLTGEDDASPITSARQWLGRDWDLHRYMRQAQEPSDPADNGLETLVLNLPTESGQVLQRVVSSALERGMIIQEESDTVPGTIEYEGRSMPAEVRIKGDWLDHVMTDKWSLRISLDDEFMGMRVFSIQHPQTRGWLWEWFVLAAMRREGVLAPRSTFVNVELNGNQAGIYYLEEHFAKELLESQGRREGPIVIWDEAAMWSTRMQAHSVASRDMDMFRPVTSQRAKWLGGSRVRAYGEKRLSSVDSLSRSLYGAIDEMNALKDLVIASTDTTGRLRALEALEHASGRLVEDLVDTERLSRAHALGSLFQLTHSMSWLNMRFYHDPVTDRLEPIMFDNMANLPGKQDPVMFGSVVEPVMQLFSTCTPYYNGVFRDLGRLCAPTYIDELVDELGAELELYERALTAEFSVLPASVAASMVQRLRAEQVYLRDIIYPSAPMHVEGFYELESSEQMPVTGMLEVSAWSLTATPVVVEGFRFENGAFVPALPNLVGELGRVGREGENGVVLPNDGRLASFRFPMDSRLANLESVQQIKQAILDSTDPGAGLAVDLEVVYRPIATPVQETRPISLRRRDPSWIQEGGRPSLPTLAEALQQHPFLEYDPLLGRLNLRPGNWEVEGDLLIPSGFSVHARGRAELRFEEDALFLTDSALHLNGTSLVPAADAASWRGLIVLKADGRSELQNVTVRNTDAAARGGWVMTGGITFYRSPVSMIDCVIEGTLAEDGLNIFGADMLLERVRFEACVSDSMDGDFVTGTIRDCVFQDGLADGVDVSGSDIDVVDCSFLNMGDKAISAGEGSTVRVSGGLADVVSIGIAAKDGSLVDAQGMTIRAARNYALAAFVKKPVYGACELRTQGLLIEGSGLGDALAQTDCVLEIDGVAQATQDLDVAQLYADKILGQ